MSMNVGSADSAEPEVMMDINTTPLIDVMLVLLVMLIITIPIQLHAVSLNMPTGTPPPQLTPPEVVKVDIDDARPPVREAPPITTAAIGPRRYWLATATPGVLSRPARATPARA